MRQVQIPRSAKVMAIIIVIMFTGINSRNFAQNPQKENLTREQKLWGLMQIWSAAKYNFVYFDHVPKLDWDAEVQASIPKILAANDIIEYCKELRELTAKLNDGHTLVMPPGALNGEFDNPPVELQMVENKIILARIGNTDETKSLNLNPGSELIEIDGVDAKEYFAKNVDKYLGGTKQYKESFGLYLLLNGPTGSNVKLKFQDRTGKYINAELTRNGMSNGFSHRIYSMMPLIEKKQPTNDVVYFKLSTFSIEQIAADFKEEIEKLDLTKVKGIVIDLRYNWGGNSSTAFNIISRLIDKPLEAAKSKSRKHLSADAAHGNAEEWFEFPPVKINPAKGKQFTGPLVILTGANTYSAAEDFLVPLKYSGRATIIGERTGGSSGQPLWVPLPGGIIFTVCAVRDSYPDGKEFVGSGIEPDIEVQVTKEDIFKNKDRVLEKAIEVILKKKK